VLLGEIRGEGRYVLATVGGEVPLLVERQGDHFRASLTSVAPRQRPVEEKVLLEALAALGWRRQDLSTDLPPVSAYAGAWHLVLAVRSLATLQRLDYDFDRLKKLMLAEDLTTLQLVWRESESLFHSRNPFPVGGVVEDPATGAAAAALGGYLRDSGRLAGPATFTIRQGEAMGRPSLLTVTVPPSGGIVVSGFGVAIPDPTPSGSRP
jgi:PhzF family phenazine biosynthesis protein